MKFLRAFTGEDGHTHYEDLVVDFAVPIEGEPSSDLELKGIRGVRLHVSSPDTTSSFHNAAGRQLAIPLTGAIESMNGTGEAIVLEPGVVELAEDLTGQGHATRHLSGPAHVLLLALDPDMSIKEIFSGHAVNPE